MQLLIRKATIIAPHHPLHREKKDIFIHNGIIEHIADHLDMTAEQEIAADDLMVSAGWMDLFADFCDPGFEYREDLVSGALAAASGGYTDVCVLPNTSPVVHNKSQVEYILQKGNNSPVTLHPIGAVSQQAEGKDLAEMYDMQQAGALLFSDGLQSVQSPGLLLKALQYVLPFNGTIVQLPDDKDIQPRGLMNESITSTQLGLPGRPAIAEELMVSRDLELLKYTGSKLHITGISTRKSVELIAKAKQEGLQVSCSVTPYHLFYGEEDVTGYDTNLKVNPPLRSMDDVAALRAGLGDGTIDGIATHHLPQHIDAKICEFEYAKNGMIGLQTSFAVLNHIAQLEGWSVEQVVHWLSAVPRSIAQLPYPKIEVGELAKLTLFNPSVPFQFQRSNNASRSTNSAFFDVPLTGKVIGTVNGHHTHFNAL